MLLFVNDIFFPLSELDFMVMYNLKMYIVCILQLHNSKCTYKIFCLRCSYFFCFSYFFWCFSIVWKSLAKKCSILLFMCPIDSSLPNSYSVGTPF
jgi:hypothetical protein